MAERDILANDQIQDYIDGRLGDRERAAVATYLLAHPEIAAEVETLRRQNEALKVVGQEILDEPVPARLRNLLERDKVVSLNTPTQPRARPRLPGFLEAAAAVLLLCAGGVMGWLANEQLAPRRQIQDLIAADAADVYAFYGTQRDYPVDFPPDRTGELASWINRSFARDVPPPDLAPLGYQYRGGRLLPTTGARTGFFQFAGPEGARLAVFFWPAERPPSQISEMGLQDDVSARYWFGDGLSFAVMSDETNPDLERIADAVFQFYEATLGARPASG